MAFPNFFVIGASRSGTTSAYNYLKAHPEIFMSAVKEPRYFAYKDKKINYKGLTDKYHINRSSVPDSEDYQQLFSAVDENKHKAVGEASPIYLYSDEAAGEIHKDIPNAKLIAILRDPVKRAYSDYLNMLRLGRDFCEPFEKAVELEDKRIKNNWGPFYHYVSKGFYYKQLSRYLRFFGKCQIAIFTHKEFVKDTGKVMEKIYSFLGVDTNFEFKNFKAYNRSGVPKNKTVHKFITHPLIPLPNFIKNFNITFSKPPMKPKIKKRLQELYANDTEKLGKEFDIDVSHWKPSF